MGDILKKEIIDESTKFKGVRVFFEMNLIGVVKAKKAEAIIEKTNEKESNSKIGGMFFFVIFMFLFFLNGS